MNQGSQEPTAPRVLIVDDNVMVCALAELVVEMQGYGAHIVHSGEAALLALDGDGVFDLVLLDMQMPGGIDGLETMRQLRASGIGVPVLLSSGLDAATLDLDPDDPGLSLVQKPYDVKTLIAAIQHAMK